MSEHIDLAARRCTPSEQGVSALAHDEIEAMLAKVAGWVYQDGVITKTFNFSDYGHTIAFVNATAWISHREDHHPDLFVGYNTCRVCYSTHAVSGVSMNDFICASKLDVLFDL